MFHFNHVTPVLQGWPRRWKLSIDRSDFFGPSWEFLRNSTNKKGKEIKTVPVISRGTRAGFEASEPSEAAYNPSTWETEAGCQWDSFQKKKKIKEQNKMKKKY